MPGSFPELCTGVTCHQLTSLERVGGRQAGWREAVGRVTELSFQAERNEEKGAEGT